MNKEDFQLKKVKVDDAGKCEISYLHTITEKEIAYSDTHIVSSPRICHQDLKNILKELVVYLADANSLKPHRALPKMSAKPQDAIKQLKQVFNQMDQEIHDSITVTGIALAGDEESESVVVTGKRRVHHTGVALNCPTMHKNGDSFGFESKVFEIVEKIKEEVFLYLTENKRSDITLFDEEGKNKDQDAA